MPWPVAALHLLIASGQVTGLAAVCRRQGAPERIDGFVLMRTLTDEAEIISIGVRTGRRRHGIGSALLKAAINRLEQAAIRSIVLEVAARNTPALRLYRRFGFCRAGYRRRYYRPALALGADAIVMRRGQPGADGTSRTTLRRT